MHEWESEWGVVDDESFPSNLRTPSDSASCMWLKTRRHYPISSPIHSILSYPITLLSHLITLLSYLLHSILFNPIPSPPSYPSPTATSRIKQSLKYTPLNDSTSSSTPSILHDMTRTNYMRPTTHIHSSSHIHTHTHSPHIHVLHCHVMSCNVTWCCVLCCTGYDESILSPNDRLWFDKRFLF